MTNKPMLSERDKFEAFWRKEMNIEAMDLHRCEFPMTAYEDQPYACHETERGRLTWMARAILDKPIVESGVIRCPPAANGLPAIAYCAATLKPAAQHQGEPVGYVSPAGLLGARSGKTAMFRSCVVGVYTIPLYAEQPAPVASSPSDKEIMLYDCAYRNGVMFGYGIGINGTEDDYQKCINRLQEQIVEARRIARLNGVKP